MKRHIENNKKANKEYMKNASENVKNLVGDFYMLSSMEKFCFGDTAWEQLAGYLFSRLDEYGELLEDCLSFYESDLYVNDDVLICNECKREMFADSIGEFDNVLCVECGEELKDCGNGVLVD